VEAARLLRQGLAGNPFLDMKDSRRVQDLLAANEREILAAKPGVAATVAGQLQCRVLVFGLLWAEGSGPRFLQMVAADCRPRVARLSATPPLPWPEETRAQQTLLLSALQAVLPPVGRVLAVISAPGQTEIQVFPFAGNPLKTDATYLAFRALAAEPEPDRAEFLPLLWAGAPAGALRTGAQRLDDVISAKPEPGAQIEIGDLVFIALTPELAAVPGTGRLLLSDPPYAQVLREGKVLGLTPLLIPAETLPGDFTISLLNYEQHSVSLAEAPRTLAADQIVLKELPLVGTIRVTSEPAGATVLLDGKEIGKTPLDARNLPAGEHTVSVRLYGYVTAEKKVQVPRAGTVEAEFALERQTRSVRVVSQPEGAEVTWDNEPVGKAPTVIARTTVGKHSVRLTLPGHAELTQEVEVTPGDKPAEFTYRLERLVGKLRIISQPPGAQVTVAGKPRGAAPLELADLAPGEYQVTALLEGYRPAERTVLVKARETTTVDFVLARKVGSINVKTVPAGAKITLDGENRGTSPALLENIPAGEHVLRLEVENLRPWEGKVTVTDGETTQVQVGLLPLQVEMGTAPGAPPAPVTPAPLPPAMGEPRQFEGSEEPPNFADLDLSDGRQHSWTFPLLRPQDAPGAPSEQIRIDLQPHADGSLTLCLQTRDPLPAEVRIEREDGVLVIFLPGLRAAHNPAGVRVRDVAIHGVRLRNGTTEGSLEVAVTLASGAQFTASRGSGPGRELILKIRRILPMGNAKMVALTFDDTPFPGYTERLLRLLREHRVVATFFVVGRKALEFPTLLRQADEDGHSLQNHSFTHPTLTQLSQDQIRAELQRCNEALIQVVGKAPRFYRPPGGQGNSEVNRIAAGLGLTYAGWDVNVHDYNTPQAQLIADRVVAGTHAGDIILLHDGVVPTLEALPDIITRLRREGFVFVTLDRLLSPSR